MLYYSVRTVYSYCVLKFCPEKKNSNGLNIKIEYRRPMEGKKRRHYSTSRYLCFFFFFDEDEDKKNIVVRLFIFTLSETVFS